MNDNYIQQMLIPVCDMFVYTGFADMVSYSELLKHILMANLERNNLSLNNQSFRPVKQ